MVDFNALLKRAGNLHNNKVAFEEGSNRKTFAEMLDAVACATNWLERHGCEEWDCIAALTDNRIETVALEWAAYRKGCIWIGIPARERELGNVRQIMTEFSPRIFLFEPTAVHRVYSSVLDRLPRYQNEISPPEIFDRDKYRVLKRDDSDDSKGFRKSARENGIVRIRYTSGAGGQPKAIFYSQKTRSAIFDQIRSKLDQVCQGHESALAEAAIHLVPIVWATGSLIAPMFSRGGKNVFLPRWDLTDFVHTVAGHRGERVLTFLTPGTLDALASYSERCGAGWAEKPKELWMMVAGSPLPVPTMRRVKRVLPSQNTRYFVTLGQTEASFPITWHEVSNEDLCASECRKTPWFVPLGRVEACYQGSAVGSDGELHLLGDAVAPGIWKEGSFQSLSAGDQAMPTGDLVEKDPEGILHYRGRKGLVPPEQPPPDAIEAIINQSPGVHRSRLDYCELGDKVFNLLTVDIRGAGIGRAEIRRWLRDTLAEETLPEFEVDHIRYGEVPLTMSGKILRDQSRCRALCDDVSKEPLDPPSGSPNQPTSECIDWRDYSLTKLESGPLYFYVGAGLSVAAGLVDWEEMACLIWWFRKHYEKRGPGLCPPREHTQEAALRNAEFLQGFVREKQRENGPPILTRESTSDEALGRTALLNLMLRYRRPRIGLSSDGQGEARPERPLVFRQRPGTEPSIEDLRLQSLIWRSRCHGVLTTNYDMLLEHAFSLYDHGAALRSYRYSVGFLRYVLSNPRFILKLHGDINDISTMEFDPWTAWDCPERLGGLWGEQLKHVYNAALRRGHIVYIGCGFRDRTIQELHNNSRDRPTESWRNDKGALRNCRVALVPEENCKELHTEFPGIQFLTHPTGRYQDVGDFLEKIVAARARPSGHRRDTWHACPEASDIHRQLFVTPDEDLKLQKNFFTESWSCMDKTRES